MRSKKGWKLAFGVLVGLALTAEAATAGHSNWFTFTLADNNRDAYSNVTSTLTFGSTRATTMTITLPSGWKVAHADNATSPFGNNSPQNNDVVAAGTATARWVLMFCTSSTQNLTGKWKEPIDAGAPANTVAQINMENALGFTTKVFVRLVSGVYDLYVPDMPDEQVCSSTTNGSTTLTTYGTVSGTTRRVSQNPSTAGTYTATATYTDTTGATHTDTESVSIV